MSSAMLSTISAHGSGIGVPTLQLIRPNVNVPQMFGVK